MATYFFDSSTIVKRYSVEKGSRWVFSVQRPSGQNTIFVARITGAEVVAALARKRKGRVLDRSLADKAIARFTRHFNRYQRVSITDEIVAYAMLLADKHELRGYDAIQLAAALALQAEISNISNDKIIFVSADS